MTSRDALLASAASLRAQADVLEVLAGQQLGASGRLTVKQAAIALGCSERHARNLAGLGQLPATKVGRGYTFDASDIESFRKRNGLRRVRQSA